MKHLLIPESLFTKEEISNAKAKKLIFKTLHNSSLKCNIVVVSDKHLENIFIENSNTNRALAIRIVSKALQISKSDTTTKASLLAICAGLGGWASSESDRLLRSI